MKQNSDYGRLHGVWIETNVVQYEWLDPGLERGRMKVENFAKLLKNEEL